MEVLVNSFNGATVVRINGIVDGMTADALLGTFQKQIALGNTRIVGDMSGVEYTSSAGLRALLATVKEARMNGGDLRLASVGGGVHRVLELSGFTSILKLYGDVDSAVASFEAGQ
jgi:anti-sigma B factor antagonist